MQGQPQKVLDVSLSKLQDWLYAASNRASPPLESWIFEWDHMIFHVL